MKERMFNSIIWRERGVKFQNKPLKEKNYQKAQDTLFCNALPKAIFTQENTCIVISARM